MSKMQGIFEHTQKSLVKFALSERASDFKGDF